MNTKTVFRIGIATLFVAGIVAGLTLLPVKDYLAQFLEQIEGGAQDAAAHLNDNAVGVQ